MLKKHVYIGQIQDGGAKMTKRKFKRNVKTIWSRKAILLDDFFRLYLCFWK